MSSNFIAGANLIILILPWGHVGAVVEEVEDLVELVLELLDGGERSDDPVALAVAPQAPLLGSLKGPAGW